MSISSISQAPSSVIPQKAQATALKTRDPDHDGDTDKAGAQDADKSSSALVNIKA